MLDTSIAFPKEVHNRRESSAEPFEVLQVTRPTQHGSFATRAATDHPGRRLISGATYASKNADSIIATGGTVEQLKEYRDDVRSRMLAHGRKGDDCKVLFLVSPIIGESRDEALGKKQRMQEAAAARPEMRLAALGFVTNIDFSVFDLDTPLGEFVTVLKTNGHQSSLDALIKGNEERTLREVASGTYGNQKLELLGSPDEVAAQMALQRRGLTRTTDAYEQFRDNLLEY